MEPGGTSMYTWPTSPPRFMYILNDLTLHFSAQNSMVRTCSGVKTDACIA